MFNDLPQFVKQTVCLNCDGCCRFKDGEQAWHAKIGIDEIYELQREKPGLAHQIFQVPHVTAGGFLASRPQTSGCRCVFFDDQRKACSIYHGHPFECRLYPFVIRRRGSDVVLSCHLACPFIQEHFGSEEYQVYVEVLKKYFQRPDVLDFVRMNPHIPGNYDAYVEELEDVLVLGITGLDTGLRGQRWILEHSLLNMKPTLAAQSYAALHLWQDFFQYEIRKIQDVLCVFAYDAAGCFMPMPPLGSLTPTLVEECFAVMRQHNGAGGVSRIENVSVSDLAVYSREGYLARLKNYEVGYFRKDLLGYHGNAYKSQRAQMNHFEKNYVYHYRAFEHSDKDACLALFDQWKKRKEAQGMEEVARYMIDDNRNVHARAMEDAAVSGLVGRVVTVDGRIAGYTFGHRVSREMFCVALEIVDKDIRGLSEFLFHALCSDESLAAYSFINVMDSFALPSVENTKMSYHPALLLASYTVTRDE